MLLTFLILTLSSSIGAAAEIHVNQTSIQAAVNSAKEGDTIIVHPGTYTENIALTRTSNLVITSASPNPDDTIIVSNDTTKDVISANSRTNLVIKGFTISGAATDHSGIYLLNCKDCTIENNKFLNDAMGIYVRSSGNVIVNKNIATKTSETGTGRGINILQSYSSTILNNTISNQKFGIYLSGSNSNTVSGNSISQSDNDSIILENSNSNILENNTANSNARFGISLSDSSSNILRGNKVSNGLNGIYLITSPKNVISGTLSRNNTISGNTVDFSSQHDIMLDNTTENTLTGNTVSGSTYGIAVRYSNNNILTGNNAYNNSIGLYVTLTSSKNTLTDNKANSNRGAGISLYRVNGNTLERNEANSNTNQGIIIDSSNDNKVFNNGASNNARGIYVSSSSSGNVLSGNTANSNLGNSGFSADGILLENTSENTLNNNNANSNNRYGIYLKNSNNSQVINNTAQSNVRGISLERSVENEVSNNILTDCSDSGLYLTVSTNNSLSKNTVGNNGQYGIALDSSENNEISSNKVSSNTIGIYMCPRSYGNKAYDNYFYNNVNALIKNNRSTWYIEIDKGKNVMGGSYIGGNFWGHPAGMGFSDNKSKPDGNEDGIIDEHFVSSDGVKESANGNITDNYPLKRVILPVADFSANPTKGIVPLTVEFKDLSKDATSISWDVNGDGKLDGSNSTLVYVYNTLGTYNATLTASNKNGENSKSVQIIVEGIKPVADFSTNVTSGYAPLSVLLTDLSQNATSRNWDIGNDGSVESTNATIVYVFTTPGTYPVSLTAINENGTSPAKTATITVTEKSSSSGGSSGGSSHSSGGSGGGGGAGSSPEPQSNVQVKELSKAQVSNGNPVKFEFPKNATCVVYVTFDAKKTAGKTTTIAEQLKGKSTLVSPLSSGEVYKYFNLWVGNSGFANAKNIENPVVCFKVEKSWLQDKKIDQNSITLNRYNDKKWSQLPVKLLCEDNKYLYFTAETPGFSFFAIAGKAVEKQKVTETKPSTSTSKPEQNNTASETKTEDKPKQVTGKDKVSSIPGFETVYVVACLIMVFLHRRK